MAVLVGLESLGLCFELEVGECVREVLLVRFDFMVLRSTYKGLWVWNSVRVGLDWREVL